MTAVETITVPKGMIIDYVSKDAVRDTPEEFVRQNFAKALHLEYGFTLQEMATEFPIKIGSSTKRIDICVFREENDRNQQSISLIVETKKPSVSSKDKKEGIEQLKSYLSACPNAEFGIWSNGIERICLHRKVERGLYSFDEIIDVPRKNESIYDVYKISKKDLKQALSDNLMFTFKRCHNYIAGNQGFDKKRAFWELLKIIFCKVQDETTSQIRFRVESKEDLLNGQLKVKARISEIFEEVKKKFPQIFSENDTIELDKRTLTYVVSQLQGYDLLNSDVDVKGVAYEQIVGANLRGDRGEFFTPRNVVKMIVKMLDVKSDESFIDPACGTGGFLITVFNHVIQVIRDEEKKRWRDPNSPTETEWFEAFRKVKDYADHNIIGLDFNPDLVKATKMNMVMNNDGQGGIFPVNSLENPHLWDEETQKHVKLESFDVLATNPPFGTQIKIDDPSILDQYQLAKAWNKNDDGEWTFDREKTRSSVPPEILFIERCLALLKPNGRMGIVLPKGILSDPKLEFVREWILINAEILATVDLPVETFLPDTGTQTCVLLLRKKNAKEREIEEDTKEKRNHPVFTKVIKYVGWNRRKKTIYKTNERGDEIVKTISKNVKEIRDGKMVFVLEQMQAKVVNDETNETAEIFLEATKGNKTYSDYLVDARYIFRNGRRLDAGYYNKQVFSAELDLEMSGIPLRPLIELSQKIYDPPLFTRIYVDAKHGVPYMTSSEMLLVSPPLNKRFISKEKTKSLESYIVEKNDVLITAAGTIGNVLLAPKYLEGVAVTSDVTRIKVKQGEKAGFIAAYLSSDIGQKLMKRSTYGSVVDRVRAHHLTELPIPDIPDDIKTKIHKLMEEAGELRTKAINCETEATGLLENELKRKRHKS
jgi:type I restriction enzyme M protein